MITNVARNLTDFDWRRHYSVEVLDNILASNGKISPSKNMRKILHCLNIGYHVFLILIVKYKNFLPRLEIEKLFQFLKNWLP